jgi:hypothetical protein
MKVVSITLPSAVHMMDHSYASALLNTQALIMKPAKKPNIINNNLKVFQQSNLFHKVHINFKLI